MKIEFIFPPAHDPSIPHIAAPMLKSYLLDLFTDIEVSTIDLNLDFFVSHVFDSNYKKMLTGIRNKLKERKLGLEKVISNLNEYDNYLKDCFQNWANKYPGYEISLRQFKAPYDRRDKASIIKFSGSESPFDILFINFLTNSEADVYCLNLSVEDQILPSFRLASLIKKLKNDAVIIWGGSLITRIYPQLCENLKQYTDYIVAGEGEMPLADIIKGLKNNTSVVPSDRIIVTTDATNRDVHQPFHDSKATNIQEQATPCFDDYDLDIYCSPIKMLPVLTSRKCYWGKCKFCTIHSGWDNLSRTRSPEEVFYELETLKKKYAISDFRIVDEAAPPNLLKELARQLITHKLNINYEIYAIAESRFRSEEFVALLGSSGCKQAYFGLESISKTALKTMGKEINRTDEMEKIFSLCEKHGIHVYTYSLFGYPGVSDSDEDETIGFLINTKQIHTATISSFIPVIGSPYAIENQNQLVHDGSLTEDLNYIYNDHKLTSTQKNPNLKAEKAVKKVYSTRKDYALNGKLNDEFRYALSKFFGPKYAQTLGPNAYSSLKGIDNAVNQSIAERITRG